MAERELSILVRAKGAVEAARNIGKVDSAVGNLGRTAAKGVKTAGANIAKIAPPKMNIFKTGKRSGILYFGIAESPVVFAICLSFFSLDFFPILR